MIITFLLQFIIGFVIAVAAAAPQNYYQPRPQYQYSGKPVVPIVAESNEINPDGSFRYRCVPSSNISIKSILMLEIL